MVEQLWKPPHIAPMSEGKRVCVFVCAPHIDYFLKQIIWAVWRWGRSQCLNFSFQHSLFVTQLSHTVTALQERLSENVHLYPHNYSILVTSPLWQHAFHSALRVRSFKTTTNTFGVWRDRACHMNKFFARVTQPTSRFICLCLLTHVINEIRSQKLVHLLSLCNACGIKGYP